MPSEELKTLCFDTDMNIKEIISHIIVEFQQGDNLHRSLFIDLVKVSQETKEALCIHNIICTEEIEAIKTISGSTKQNKVSHWKIDDALVFLGLLAREGLLTNKPDYPEAIDFYEYAIALGNSNAMNSRAFMYHEGQGGPVDYLEAIELYERSITLGNSDAMNNRACMYNEGQGGPIDTAFS